MNTKSFLLGVATGLAAATIIQKTYPASTFKQPDMILHKIKNRFKESGPITGSWIEMKPQSYSKDPFVYNVYKGGITRDHEQWEFIADAKTGVILDVKPR